MRHLVHGHAAGRGRGETWGGVPAHCDGAAGEEDSEGPSGLGWTPWGGCPGQSSWEAGPCLDQDASLFLIQSRVPYFSNIRGLEAVFTTRCFH